MLFRKTNESFKYDSEKERPIIRGSICTGERVAGFKEIQTGKFREVMLIRNDRDLEDFLKKYKLVITQIKTEY